MADNADIVANYCVGFQEIFHGANPALWYNITATTALTYGLLTLIVNIRVYTVLLNSRKMKGSKNEFSSPFYSVFIIASIVDSCWWVSNQLKDHFALAPALHFMFSWIPATGFVISFWFFSVIYFMLADMLITVLVSLNRFLTIIFSNGDMIWKKVFPIGLLTVFLLPLVFTWNIWFNSVVMCNIENFGNLYIIINEIENTYGIQLNLGVFSVTFCSAIINAILNISTIISVVRQRKQISNNHGSKKTFKHVKGPEMKLLIISFIMFINQCSFSSIHLNFFLSTFIPDSQDRNERVFEVSRFVIDFMCLSPMWILLIINKRLRKIILPRSASNQTIIVKSITNTTGLSRA